MIAWFANQIKMAKCDHEFDYEDKQVEDMNGTRTVRFAHCPKCGYSMKNNKFIDE